MTRLSRVPLEEIDAIVQRYRSGESLESIGKMYGFSRATTTMRMRGHGVPVGRGVAHLTEEDKRSICVAYENGEHLKPIARRFHIEEGSMRALLIESGVKIPPKGQNFTDEEEQNIVVRYEAGEPLASIIKDYVAHPLTIRNVVKRQKGKVRPIGGRERHFSDDELSSMRTMRASGISQEAIGQILGVSQATLRRALLRHGIEAENKGPQWRGKRVLNSRGYVTVQIFPDNPYFGMAQCSGYVLEHRLVMAEHLGRPLDRREQVHHIDGDKANNAIENLEIRQSPHGNGQAWVCQDCGSHNVKPMTLCNVAIE